MKKYLIHHSPCCPHFLLFIWCTHLFCSYFIWKFVCSFVVHLHLTHDTCSMRIKALSVYLFCLKTSWRHVNRCSVSSKQRKFRYENLRQFLPSPRGHIWFRCSWHHRYASHELWRSSALVLPTRLDRWTASHSQNIKNEGKLLSSVIF